jgi:hypothetical protein
LSVSVSIERADGIQCSPGAILALLNLRYGFQPSIGQSNTPVSTVQISIISGGWRGVLSLEWVAGQALSLGFQLCQATLPRSYSKGWIAWCDESEIDAISLFRKEEALLIRKVAKLPVELDAVLTLLTLSGDPISGNHGIRESPFQSLLDFCESRLFGDWFLDENGYYIGYGPSGFPPSTGRWQGNPEFPWVGFEQFMEGLRN